MNNPYDAIVLISFGGPEGDDDIMPFLNNVLRGKNVPEHRKMEVAEHYRRFSGISPINEQNRRLISALQAELNAHGINIPIYWGNRNWHPLLKDTFAKMAQDGINKALAFVTSAYSSYSGCRQYLENIAQARKEVGPQAPAIDKIRVFYNHPRFIKANCDRIREAAAKLTRKQKETAHLIFTAHSIPLGMADTCAYEQQLLEVCKLLTDEMNWQEWKLVYQSRSGSPSQPWLEPDICDYLRSTKSNKIKNIILAPIGFLSDHLEVLYDLDTEAAQLCGELGIAMIRANTLGAHPEFIAMIRELIEERLFPNNPRRQSIGNSAPALDTCPDTCCLPL